MSESIVHSMAVIHPGSRLGRGTEVGPYAVVEEDVEIGTNCRISAHAVIKRYTVMGDHNHIFEGAILGGIPQDLRFSGARSDLRIGSHNVFREGVTVHRATQEGSQTLLGNHLYLMAYAHVAHECRLEDHVILANNVALAGHVHLEDHTFVSGGVVIHQFCRVGRFAMIGGNSKITQDVLPFFITDGVPGRLRGPNLVGLRRGGFSDAEISDVKRAYRILSKKGVKLSDKLALMASIDSAPVRHLGNFIQRSERGFCGS